MNGASEATEIGGIQSLYPSWSSLGSIVLFRRAGNHRGPESILSLVAEFGTEVLMLKRLGRGVTRPLHWREGGGVGGVQVGGLKWWRLLRIILLAAGYNGWGLSMTSPLSVIPLVADVNRGSGVVAFPTNRSGNTSPTSAVGFSPYLIYAWTCRLGLWPDVWSETFFWHYRGSFTDWRWWWNRKLCLCWAGLAPAREPSAPKL